MQTQTAAQSIELQPSESIYEKYINPFIETSQSGDELLYVSPSAFWGFYSIGARNFVKVCDCLFAAKKRGVKIRVIIDVHDILTSKAAEGLLTFLLDGIELKHLEGNTDTYFLLVYGVSGKNRYVSFLSHRPETHPYLPNVQVRRFKKTDQFRDEMPTEDAEGKRAEFYRLWEDSATRVGPVINRYFPGYQIRRRIALFQTISYLLALGLGLVLGVSFALQGLPTRLDALTILILLIATSGAGLVTGLLGTWLSNWFTNKFVS